MEEVEEMEWVCGVCGYTTPLEEVIQWDEELRERLASCLDEENVFGEEVLRKLMSDALQRCHPNHAILLQARLALSACTLGDVNTTRWLKEVGVTYNSGGGGFSARVPPIALSRPAEGRSSLSDWRIEASYGAAILEEGE